MIKPKEISNISSVSTNNIHCANANKKAKLRAGASDVNEQCRLMMNASRRKFHLHIVRSSVVVKLITIYLLSLGCAQCRRVYLFWEHFFYVNKHFVATGNNEEKSKVIKWWGDRAKESLMVLRLVVALHWRLLKNHISLSGVICVWIRELNN